MVNSDQIEVDHEWTRSVEHLELIEFVSAVTVIQPDRPRDPWDDDPPPRGGSFLPRKRAPPAVRFISRPALQ
jgi:hypothetical protein